MALWWLWAACPVILHSASPECGFGASGYANSAVNVVPSLDTFLVRQELERVVHALLPHHSLADGTCSDETCLASPRNRKIMHAYLRHHSLAATNRSAWFTGNRKQFIQGQKPSVCPGHSQDAKGVSRIVTITTPQHITREYLASTSSPDYASSGEMPLQAQGAHPRRNSSS